jgi:hypothetical protein
MIRIELQPRLEIGQRGARRTGRGVSGGPDVPHVSQRGVELRGLLEQAERQRPGAGDIGLGQRHPR